MSSFYVLKKWFEEKEVLPEGSNLLKRLPEEMSYLREENEVKSEIIRMLVRQTKRLSLFAHKCNGYSSSRKTNNRSRHYTNETNKNH